MKKNALLSYVLILCLGLLVSCAKPAGSGPVLAPVTSSMSATINGVSWVGTNFSGTNVSGTLGIEAANADGSQFNLNIPASTGTGSYSVGGMSNYQIIYESGNSYCTMAGNIKITSNSNNAISGTFSGTLTNTTTQVASIVTGGVFTSTY